MSTRPISTFVDGAFAPKPPGAGSIVAIARASGQIASRVDGVRGQWPARDGSDRIEIAVDGQVVSYRRDLGEPIGQTLPPVGELIDARGDRRLVRATPFTAALLDRTGVRAMIPLAQSSHPDVTIRGDAGVELATAAIGDAAIIAGTGTSPGAAVFRIAMPPKLARMVRTTAPHPGTTMPAELRDLPAIAELPRDREIPKVDTGKYGVAAIALDPDPAAQALYAIALELPATTVTTTTIARADLAIKSWTWQRTDGCAAGVPVGIAVAADVVVCASRGQTSTVRATSRDGKAAWDSILLDNVDRVIAGGDAIVAFDADRATVLDTQGKIRGRLMSGDGAQVRAAIVVVPNLEAPGTTASWLVTAERGRLVARLPTVQMLGVWSLDVRGVVRSIEPSGDGVLVVLDDGDAYRVSLRDAAVTAMPGLGLAWRADGELITGAAVGGPVPGVPGVRPFGPPVPPRDAYGKPLDPLDPKLGEAPSVWIPIPAPAPLGDSWQLTLYERGGAFRVRNDYGLAWPIGIGARGPIGSPFVVASAGGALVIDPRTGDPVRRFALPDGGHVFGTIVDGAPVGGVVVGKPLRVVLF